MSKSNLVLREAILALIYARRERKKAGVVLIKMHFNLICRRKDAVQS